MQLNRKVLTGTHFEMGNWACTEGAIAAGCNFAAGYPITPASEIANFLAARLPEAGGTFLQSEDEISAICAAIGASWAGCKAMTVTSGPGISLMTEGISYIAAANLPVVLVNIMRGGPGLGRGRQWSARGPEGETADRPARRDDHPRVVTAQVPRRGCAARVGDDAYLAHQVLLVIHQHFVL